jgi:hypothetical protein
VSCGRLGVYEVEARRTRLGPHGACRLAHAAILRASPRGEKWRRHGENWRRHPLAELPARGSARLDGRPRPPARRREADGRSPTRGGPAGAAPSLEALRHRRCRRVRDGLALTEGGRGVRARDFSSFGAATRRSRRRAARRHDDAARTYFQTKIVRWNQLSNWVAATGALAGLRRHRTMASAARKQTDLRPPAPSFHVGGEDEGEQEEDHQNDAAHIANCTTTSPGAAKTS